MGKAAEGDEVRLTRKGSDVYATILGIPKTPTAAIVGVAARPGLQVTMLGDAKLLDTKEVDGVLQVTLPEHLPGNSAYVLKLVGYAQ